MRTHTALRSIRSRAPACVRCCSSTASSSALAAASAASTSTAAPANARLRFAPSPTGFLHLGGLRTALFNHLLARKWGGKWLLRIEDTDQTRLVPGAVDALRRTLEWAGLDYDEGVGAGGALGPYTQSERLDIYRHHVEKLIDSGHAYECFCSVDSLKELKAQLRAQGHMHGYDGRCRHLSRDDVQQRKRAGHCYTVRFKTQTEKEMLPADLIFGQSQPMAVASGADDFVILKGDGFPTYHLASVVDDHLMEISHVLRGEEWLPSVTKHHQLYRAFGWAPPQFGHLPLLANADGTKLSKRTGDVNVEAYREKGYEPEAIINFLGLMGWDHQAALRKALAEDGGDGKLPAHGRSDSHSMYEVFTLPQLVAAFDINLVTHRRAAVDMNKLDFINKMTIRRKAGRLDADGHLAAIGKVDSHRPSEGGRDDLAHRYQAGLRKLPQLEGNNLIEDFDYVGKVFDVELPRSVRISEMPAESLFFYLPPDLTSEGASEFLNKMFEKISPSTYLDGVRTVFDILQQRTASGELLNDDMGWDAIHAARAKLGLKKNSDITLPLRHALTGRKAGPGVTGIMEVLGTGRALPRLRAGLRHVAKIAREQ